MMSLRYIGHAVFSLCILLQTSLGSGPNLCPSSEMKFHPPTNTCFLVVGGRWAQWEEARIICRQCLGGEFRDRPGYLPRVLDEETNSFLKGIIPESKSFWLGLTYSKWPYMWNGRGPLKSGDYVDWAHEEPNPNHRHVVLRHDGWHRISGLNLDTYVICQIPAAVPPVHVEAAPSVRNGKGKTTIASCSFSNRTWTQLLWQRGSDNKRVAVCDQRDGVETLMSMSLDSGYDVSIATSSSGVTESHLTVIEVGRKDAALWTCLLFDGDTTVGQNSRHVHVYEPAHDIQCRHEIDKQRVKIYCRTARVYPKPWCVWRINTDDGGSTYMLPQTIEKTSSHRVYHTPDGGIDYFTSTCGLWMTAGRFPFTAGPLNLSVSMYATWPDGNGGTKRDKSTGVSQNHMLMIELPGSPTFKLSSGEKITSPFYYTPGEEINIDCYVLGGTPEVFMVTVWCDFPNKVRVKDELSVSMTSTLTSKMNQTRCFCHGNHITGKTEKTPLLFITLQHEKERFVDRAISSPEGADSHDKTNDYLSDASTERVRITTTQAPPTIIDSDDESSSGNGADDEDDEPTGQEIINDAPTTRIATADVVDADEAGSGFMWKGVVVALGVGAVAMVMSMAVLVVALKKGKRTELTTDNADCTYKISVAPSQGPYLDQVSLNTDH